MIKAVRPILPSILMTSFHFSAAEELFCVAGYDVVEGFLINNLGRSDHGNQAAQVGVTRVHEEVIIE